jgi:hypothetical protein
MENVELLVRWRVLLNEPSNAITIRGVLQERLVILHRLNELGEINIDGLSIVNALEETNVSMRETDGTIAATG